MKSPSITINGVTYISATPKMGLWRQLQSFKTERRERAQALEADLKVIEATKEDKEKLGELLDNIESKAESNRQFVSDGMLQIILAAFPDIENPEEINLEDIPVTYELIKTWLELIMSGRLAKLPNVETPTES